MADRNHQADIDNQPDKNSRTEESGMEEINQTVKCGGEQIRLVLQFPKKSQNSHGLQKEIRAILLTELLRQMKETADKRKEI